MIESKNDSEAQQLSQLYLKYKHPFQSYVYEPFDLTLKLYIREGIQIDNSISILGGLPEQGIDGNPDWKRVHQRTGYPGSYLYNHHLKNHLQTITAGTFTFEPKVQLNLIVPRQNRRSYGLMTPSGDFFGRHEHRPVKLECNKLSLPVRPIPQKIARPPMPVPSDIRFSKHSPNELKTGEPITLTSQIKGMATSIKLRPHPRNEHCLQTLSSTYSPHSREQHPSI